MFCGTLGFRATPVEKHWFISFLTKNAKTKCETLERGTSWYL